MALTYLTISLGNLVLLAVLMKFMAARLVTTNQTIWRTPALLSTNTSRPTWISLLLHQLLFFILFFLYLGALRLTDFTYEIWWQRLSAAPLVWFTTEWLGASLLILFGRPRLTSLIHREPWKAASISAFWGQRWNRWVSPWLGMMAGALTKSITGRICWAFTLSGLVHELLFNLPFHYFTGIAYYGNMMIFFCLHGLLTLVDRYWLRTLPSLWRRIWLWACLVLTVPIFLERPGLYFFGLFS